MNLAELDQALADWKRDLENIVHNTLELTDLVTYGTVTSRVQAGGRLSGRSARELPAAVAAMGELLEQLPLLQDKIDAATRARAALPRLGRARALADIQAMLEGESIVLGAEEVPLDQRTLLSSAANERRIAPAELKRSMVASFERAKPVFLRVEQVWTQVGLALGRAQSEAASLIARFRAQGKPLPRPVEQLRARLAELEAQLHEDPLGLDFDADEFLAPYWRGALRALEALETEARALHERVAQEGARLQRLRALLDELAVLRTQAREPADQTLVAQADALEARLLELELDLGERPLAELEGALVAWGGDLGGVLAAARAQQSNVKARLARREELLLRWQAARARLARATPAVRQSKALATFGERIDQLLGERASAEEVDRMIYAFETRLDEMLLGSRNR